MKHAMVILYAAHNCGNPNEKTSGGLSHREAWHVAGLRSEGKRPSPNGENSYCRRRQYGRLVTTTGYAVESFIRGLVETCRETGNSRSIPKMFLPLKTIIPAWILIGPVPHLIPTIGLLRYQQPVSILYGKMFMFVVSRAH